MAQENGEKSIMKYVLLTIILSLTGWGLLEIVQTKADQAALHTQVDDLKSWMQKIDAKLDRALDK